MIKGVLAKRVLPLLDYNYYIRQKLDIIPIKCGGKWGIVVE